MPMVSTKEMSGRSRTSSQDAPPSSDSFTLLGMLIIKVVHDLALTLRFTVGAVIAVVLAARVAFNISFDYSALSAAVSPGPKRILDAGYLHYALPETIPFATFRPSLVTGGACYNLPQGSRRLRCYSS